MNDQNSNTTASDANKRQGELGIIESLVSTIVSCLRVVLATCGRHIAITKLCLVNS